MQKSFFGIHSTVVIIKTCTKLINRQHSSSFYQYSSSGIVYRSYKNTSSAPSRKKPRIEPIKTELEGKTDESCKNDTKGENSFFFNFTFLAPYKLIQFYILWLKLRNNLLLWNNIKPIHRKSAKIIRQCNSWEGVEKV